MNWTKTPPTRAGVYLFLPKYGKPEAVLLYQNEHDQLLYQEGVNYPSDAWDGQWSGLFVPVEEEGEQVSDTPRTDAEQEHVANLHNDQVCCTPPPDPYYVPAEFARGLERELAAIREWGGRCQQEMEHQSALKNEWRECAELLAQGCRVQSVVRVKVALDEFDRLSK